MSDQTLGAELRRMREAMGLKPADIEVQLRIKAEYVTALEDGAYEKLPSGNQGGAYGRGFLRSYAKFLGLEAELPRLLQLYAAERTAVDAAPILQMPKPLSEGKTADKKTMLVAVVAAVVIVMMWGALQESPAPPALPPVQLATSAAVPAQVEAVTPAIVPPTALDQQVQQSPADQPIAAQSTAVPEPVTASAPPKLVVRALRDSWLQITDATGATIFSRLLGQGEDYVVPSQAGLMLSTGNAGGLVLVKEGKEGAPLGAPAEVKRGIVLTPKAAVNE